MGGEYFSRMAHLRYFGSCIYRVSASEKCHDFSGGDRLCLAYIYIYITKKDELALKNSNGSCIGTCNCVNWIPFNFYLR